MTASSWGKYLQFLLLLAVTTTVITLEVSIQSMKTVHRVNEEFISLSVDPDILLENKFTSEKVSQMLLMARALSPAYLRLAGPKTSLYHFTSKNSIAYNTSISESQMEAVVKFARAANLRLVVAVSATPRREDGSWDDSQAKRFLKFADFLTLNISVQMGFDRPRSEPSVSGVALGEDIEALARLLNWFPRYRQALILGPDIGNLDSDKEIKRSTDIIKIAGDSLSVITWHPTPFILHPSKDVDKVVDRASGVIDNLTIKTRQLHNMLRSTIAETKHIWLGDSSTTKNYGRFVDALMWVSQLGQAAKLNINTVMHSPTYEELVNPTPAFWVSVLYRQLVGRDVLDTRLHSGDRRRVHAFAHCSRDGAASGGVTLFAVNYSPYAVSANVKTIWVPQTKTGIRKYVLTSPKGPLSRNISLNGKNLELLPSGDVPIFEPELLSTTGFGTNIYIPALSVTFWEIPGAYAKACMQTKTYKKSDLMIKRRISNRTKREAIQETKITHFTDKKMITSDAGSNHQLNEEDYMNPGGSIYAFLSPPNKNTKTVKVEPILIEPEQYHDAQGTRILSPAEMHFCYEKVQPADIFNSNNKNLKNMNYDDLFAAEYGKIENNDTITSNEKSIAQTDTSSDIQREMHDTLVHASKIENISVPISFQKLSLSINNNRTIIDETSVENIKSGKIQNQNNLNITDIDMNDDTKYSSPDLNDDNQTGDILMNLDGVLDPESAINESQIMNSSYLGKTLQNEQDITKVSEVGGQNKSNLSLTELMENKYSNEDDFHSNEPQTKENQRLTDEDKFNEEIKSEKEHTVLKRDLERYRNFLHHKNYLKLKDISRKRTGETTTEKNSFISPITTQAPLKEENTTKQETISTTLQSRNKVEIQKPKLQQKSFSVETLKESQQKRKERLNELKEKISSMLKDDSVREKRQTDGTGEEDDDYPEFPILEPPKSFLGLKQKSISAAEPRDSNIVPRMNLQGLSPLYLDNSWNPSTLPSIIDPQILRIIGKNLPMFQQQTFPTLPNLPSLTLKTLPFNLLERADSRASETSEKVSPGQNNNFMQLPSLSFLNLSQQPITANNSTSGPITSLFQGIGSSLASLTSQNRMRRQLGDNSCQKEAAENSNTQQFSLLIPANILRIRLPSIASNNVAPTAKQIQRSQNLNKNNINDLLYFYKLPRIFYSNRIKNLCHSCKNENILENSKTFNLFKIQNENKNSPASVNEESLKKHTQPMHHRIHNLKYEKILNTNFGNMLNSNKPLNMHKIITRKMNRRRPSVTLNKNGNIYIQEEDMSSVASQNNENLEWPDEYNMEKMGSESHNIIENVDWPLRTTKQSDYEISHPKQTRGKTSRSKRYADVSKIDMDKLKNSLSYRFKKWELEDNSEINELDAIYNSMIIDKIWKKKLFAKLSKDQTQITKVMSTTTPTPLVLSTSTEKPKINMKRVGGAIHKFFIIPIINGASLVFSSFRNFLNGERSF